MVRKRSIRMTLTNNSAPLLLSNIKFCPSFHHHMWFQSGVTVQKRLSGGLSSVALTFDLWLWPFAWSSLLPLVITIENFMMMRSGEYSKKGCDRRTDWTIHRATWSQLRIKQIRVLVVQCLTPGIYDDVIKWKHFPRYWPSVRGINRSPVNSPHKGQWRGALMFSLICIWIKGWVNNREAGDLRRYRAHYDVTVMEL